MHWSYISFALTHLCDTTLSSLLSDRSIAEERSVYPEADITLDGLYNMLTTIQEALPGMRKADELYRGMSPALSVRNDIIQ